MEKVISRVNCTDASWSAEDWLERGRMWWKASPSRIIDCDLLVVIDANNVVRAVGRIEGVSKDLDSASGRIAITARPEVDSKWLGKTIERPSSRNPVVYVDKLREVR